MNLPELKTEGLHPDPASSNRALAEARALLEDAGYIEKEAE